jgi:hypothetical protein
MLSDLQVGPKEVRWQGGLPGLRDDETSPVHLGELARLRHEGRELLARSCPYDRIVGRPLATLKVAGIIVPIERVFPPPEDMRDWWRFVDWKHRRNLELVAQAA